MINETYITDATKGVNCAVRQGPRRMNECFVKTDNLPRADALFDAFWREGELALMFGPAGVGKSVLAMQMAEAVARGRGIGRFAMPTYRRKVLYVDLVMSDAEIQRRYSYKAGALGDLKSYKFSGSLYRDRPEDKRKLGDWLRETVLKDGFRVVVIDDLSAIRQTADGTREPLKLMRELKKVKEEFGISVLVLAGSIEPRRSGAPREADLGRSRVLCDVADSVFALGRHGRSADDRCLVQLRSRNAALVWNAYNAPIGRMGRMDDGFLGFTFDERFAERLGQETLDLICQIKAMYDGGKKFRAIAEELGMAQSQTWRLYQKWRPEMAQGQDQKHLATNEHEQTRIKDSSRLSVDSNQGGDFTGGDASVNERASTQPVGTLPDGRVSARTHELDEWDEAGFERPEWVEEEGDKGRRREEEKGRRGNGETKAAAAAAVGGASVDGSEVLEKAETANGYEMTRTISRSMDVTRIPFAAGLRRRNIYELKRTLNAYDKEIFVESESADGKPLIWYHVDNKGYVNRWIRRGGGPEGKRLGPAPYIEIGGWQPEKRGWRIYIPDKWGR